MFIYLHSVNISEYIKTMKNKVILLLLLFAFTFTKAAGQKGVVFELKKNIVYKYDAQGSCTSRVIKGVDFNPKRPRNISPNTELFKVVLSPSTNFKDYLTISIEGFPSDYALSYVMANISGQVFFDGSIENESVTLNTSALPKGIYVLKVSGDNCENSYKLLKD